MAGEGRKNILQKIRERLLTCSGGHLTIPSMNATETVELKMKAIALLRAAVAEGDTIEAIAKRTGAKPEALGRWLGGQNLPRENMARKIIRAVSGS